MSKRPQHPDKAVEKHLAILENAHWTVVYSENKQAYYLTCQVGDSKEPCLTILRDSTPGTAAIVKNFIEKTHKIAKGHKGSYP